MLRVKIIFQLNQFLADIHQQLSGGKLLENLGRLMAGLGWKAAAGVIISRQALY
ncbi:hypothetical protein [Nitrosomonas sp. ANs5]|uniref:hypothetical protein n=1 Tax=Nitrosomonas sp. ANs5 TaxID=3423941 RepID=UPI003D344287